VLRFYGQLYGLGGRDLTRRIDEVLEVVGMTHARKRYIRGYSKGMRQRIGLAQALINDPQILILDEPTTGLDPIARKDIRDILVRLRDEGKTLLISSHELLEVELISNRVGILYEGVLQTQGTLDELLSERDITIRAAGVTPEALTKLDQAGIQADDRIEERALLRVPADMSLYSALEVCKSANVSVASIAPRRETLEELFVRTVGEAGRHKSASHTEGSCPMSSVVTVENQGEVREGLPVEGSLAGTVGTFLRGSWSIAKYTWREGMRKKTLIGFLILSMLVIFGSFFLTAFLQNAPLGDAETDVGVKLVKDICVTAITIFGVLITIFVSASVVPSEVDNRVVYTILSKPVRRFQYLLGSSLASSSS
jgi:ABC-type proline/glycine betaine transport system ATPase subunit